MGLPSAEVTTEIITIATTTTVVAPPDLLAHKYKPTSVDTISIHREQAKRLRQWILDFTDAPRNENRHGTSQSSSDSDYDERDDMSDDSGAEDNSARKCVLITGPPGVGKTSLVYMIASELRMHIVESHASEKRDFKLFKTLKLANQKGKINPIARLFQMTQQKQQKTIQSPQSSKRKRRKLEQTNGTTDIVQADGTKNQCLSASGGSSIVLFDDIDVVFEEDGPFLKSLAEFIRDSKRPVIVTATKSIEHIKNTLIHFEHIQLNRPPIDDCVKLLRNVCRREKYQKLNKITNCRIIAKKLNCDIRQCLNRIHFYGDKAFRNIEFDTSDIQNIRPDLSRLSGHLEYLTSKYEDEEKTDIEGDNDDDETTMTYNHDLIPTTLACYDTACIIDLMDRKFDFVDRSTHLTRWLDGTPTHRDQIDGCELGDQIRKSIVDIAQNLHKTDLMANDITYCVDKQQPSLLTTLDSPVCRPRRSSSHRFRQSITAGRKRNVLPPSLLLLLSEAGVDQI